MKTLFIFLQVILSLELDICGRSKHLHFVFTQSTAEKRQQTQSQFSQTSRFRTSLRRESATQPRPEIRGQPGLGPDPERMDASNPRSEAKRLGYLWMPAQYRTKVKKSSGKLLNHIQSLYSDSIFIPVVPNLFSRRQSCKEFMAHVVHRWDILSQCFHFITTVKLGYNDHGYNKFRAITTKI